MDLLLAFAITTILTLTTAFAQRRSDYWRYRTVHGRQRGAKDAWFWNAAKSWNRRWVFWSNLYCYLDAFRLTAVLLTLLTAWLRLAASN